VRLEGGRGIGVGDKKLLKIILSFLAGNFY
jgi:hypothetical protein